MTISRNHACFGRNIRGQFPVLPGKGQQVCYTDQVIIIIIILLMISVFLTHDKIDAYIQEQTVCQVDSTNGSKYWNCGICQKYLYKKQDLTRHIESFHVETTPYFCSMCDAQFNTRRACKRHTLSIHSRS